MKKRILLLSALLGFASLTQAQKLALMEEFSGENCGPCATLNPAFMALINASGNSSKVLLLKYQAPIPSAGPIYNANTVFTDARMDYYSVNFAPYARLDGTLVGSGSSAGNISLATQAMIDAAAAVSTPFTISVGNPVYNANGQTFTSTITVTASSATTVSNGKLRVALAEELQYTTPPGTNGETHFQNVVRQMYPDANGQTFDANWTAGQSRTYTVTGSMPSYVSPTAPTRFLAAFIQDETNKKVLQAARTPGNITIQLPQADAAITGLTLPPGLICQVPATVTGATTVLKNTGSATLTSATIYSKLSSATTWTTQAWTGSLAPGATTTVTINPFTIAGAGQQVFIDSVGMPNNKVDLNDFDNLGASLVTVLNPTANALPLFNDFEAVNENWIGYAGTGGYPMLRAWSGSASQPIGANNSAYFIYARNPYLNPGVAGYYILPKATMPAGAKALDFDLSYAMRASVGDKLEVVYSTDCGATWSSVWSKQNAELATTTSTAQNTLHIPTAATYKPISVDMTNVPTNAYVAFRATSGGGNYCFVDNVRLRPGAPNSIDEIVESNTISLFPNPVVGDLNVEISMKKSSDVVFTVVNSLGQEVSTSVKNLNVGNQTVNIETSKLAAGIYILNIKTTEGNTQRKFVKN